MDDHRKTAEEIASLFASKDEHGDWWWHDTNLGNIIEEIETRLRSTASKSEKDGYRKGVDDSASCVVGIFPTARSAEILRSAIRRLIRDEAK